METIGLCKAKTDYSMSYKTRSDERWKGTGVFLQCHENLISDELKT